jgi:hypothetical protein
MSMSREVTVLANAPHRSLRAAERLARERDGRAIVHDSVADTTRHPEEFVKVAGRASRR